MLYTFPFVSFNRDRVMRLSLGLFPGHARVLRRTMLEVNVLAGVAEAVHLAAVKLEDGVDLHRSDVLGVDGIRRTAGEHHDQDEREAFHRAPCF
jgi:hypothetical protein